jgi:hypothetical protein
MEFERMDVSYDPLPTGPDAWSTDDESFEVEGEIFVDEFIWPVMNAFVTGQATPAFLTTSPEFQRFQEAVAVRDGSFVYRLGYLGVTYDADAIAHLVDIEDEFIVSARTLADMLRTLREVYFLHNEEDAVGALDGFLGMVGGHLLRNERLSWVSTSSS